MKEYIKSITTVLEDFETNENGLSTEEANKRIEKYGMNKLDEEKKQTIFQKFLSQIIDPMIILLLVAAAISAYISFVNNESNADGIIILFVVLINAVLGVIQESKAEEAIDSLKEMTKAKSSVYRDGILQTIDSEYLVPGDIVFFEAGNQVSADCRIIEAYSLQVEESSLSGESMAVDKISEVLELGIEKDISLGDRTNMLYMGTTVVSGRAKAVVVATGMDTEVGHIAKAITEVVEEKTPLQKSLAELSKMLTFAVIIICIVIFILAVFSSGSLDFATVIIPSFMVAVSLAVAAIPEGLSAVVTIVLSIGVTRMSKRKAIIRKLTAVETLGCTQVICSDKTGTLTQNKMTVVEVKTSDKKLLAEILALASDAYIEKGEAKGEATEEALANFAFNMGIDKLEIEKTNPRISEIPFDSTRKLMTTFYGNRQFTKGAPDELLDKCSKALIDGKIVDITNDIKNQIIKENRDMANRALRVLGGAYKEVSNIPDRPSANECERNLIFVGLVGMIDPVRPEVFEAIKECKEAGIRIVMITGDHKNTAAAIAKQLQIIESDDEALMGLELDQYDDGQLAEVVKTHFVYARVKPEHKVRIVNAWKKNGNIVAMTGDGVNDAPSIKAADIGIGMGITGTDVTKNVADMVLADDNFATIVNAIEEGRIIYSNIKKSIFFLLSSNLSEVITILVATMMRFVILEAPHLLWINMITDCFPALSLGLEPAEDDIMLLKPREKKESLFANGAIIDIVFHGIFVSMLTLFAYQVGKSMLPDARIIMNPRQGITMAFLTMSMAEIFHSFNMRSVTKSIFSLKKKNVFLIVSFFISLILTFTVIEVPFFATMFKFENLDFIEYIVGIAIAILIIPIVEIYKFLKKHLLKLHK